jgi:hypothetical protein
MSEDRWDGPFFFYESIDWSVFREEPASNVIRFSRRRRLARRQRGNWTLSPRYWTKDQLCWILTEPIRDSVGARRRPESTLVRGDFSL